MKKTLFPNLSALAAIGSLLLLVACQEDPATDPPNGLADAFEEHFLVGGTLSDSMLRDSLDPGYPIVKSNFNSLSPENCMKWGRINPEPGVYEFELADAFVAYGESNDMVLVGHTLFWHSQTPDWVFQDDAGNPISKDALLARMRERAELMVDRWGDKIEYWDVVNESIEHDGSWRKSNFQQILGDEFTELAFQIASDVLPSSAKLLYNDYSMDKPGRRDTVVAMIKNFQSKGIRIDGIGLQGHWSMVEPKMSDISKSIDAFAATGVEVHITELDLDFLGRNHLFGANIDVRRIKPNEENNPFPGGELPAAEEERFEKRYVEIFETLVSHSQQIQRVTFWGISDKTSWLNNFPVTGRTNYPLLFDRQFQPKAAYQKVIETARPDKR